MRARELRISSVSPSEKYSCSFSPLMFTNGSTAMECGGGLKASWVARVGAAVCAADTEGGIGDVDERLGTKNLSAAMYASATASTAPIAHGPALDRHDEATAFPD